MSNSIGHSFAPQQRCGADIPYSRGSATAGTEIRPRIDAIHDRSTSIVESRCHFAWLCRLVLIGVWLKLPA
jgi:hypothetical protein